MRCVVLLSVTISVGTDASCTFKQLKPGVMGLIGVGMFVIIVIVDALQNQKFLSCGMTYQAWAKLFTE